MGTIFCAFLAGIESFSNQSILVAKKHIRDQQMTFSNQSFTDQVILAVEKIPSATKYGREAVNSPKVLVDQISKNWLSI